MAGYTTIHAGSARQALTRLRFISQLAETSSGIPVSALSNLVSEAIDVVVHCARQGGRIQITEIVAVEDLQSGSEAGAFTTTQVFARESPNEALRWTGDLPTRCARALEVHGYDLRSLIAQRTEHPIGRWQ